MMVTIAIIGLAMSLIFGTDLVALPQSRLKASAAAIANALDQMRTHALFAHRDVVFTYNLDENGFEAYEPVERDGQGRIVGPGRTPIIDFTPLNRGMAIESLVLPEGSPRESGLVSLPISPLGRIAPHDIVVYNPEYPELEVLTVRVSGLTIRQDVLEGRQKPVLLDDGYFR